MIFYFTGTGNSYAVARFFSDHLNEDLVDIAQAMKNKETEFQFREDEKLGFVFPVYAWAPPKMVLDFIKKLVIHCDKQPYTYGICTCGATAGNTMNILKDALSQKGISMDSGYSVVMPDNFVIMFKVDTLAKQNAFLQEAQKTMERILDSVIQQKRKFYRVKRGKVSRLLTVLFNPIFQRYGTKTKPFYANDDCIHCGLCEKICTDNCIQLINGIPQWAKAQCNMCLACVNRCPKGAIQYGKKTKDKGQYVHPCWK